MTLKSWYRRRISEKDLSSECMYTYCVQHIYNTQEKSSLFTSTQYCRCKKKYEKLSTFIYNSSVVVVQHRRQTQEESSIVRDGYSQNLCRGDSGPSYNKPFLVLFCQRQVTMQSLPSHSSAFAYAPLGRVNIEITFFLSNTYHLLFRKNVAASLVRMQYCISRSFSENTENPGLRCGH